MSTHHTEINKELTTKTNNEDTIEDTTKSKNKLLTLDKERLKIEKEIIEITDYLNQEGFPGVDKSLIDEEGFPLPGLDLYSIREARNRLIRIQNDHKSLMMEIEKEMEWFFSTEKNKVKHEKEKKIILSEDNKQLVQVFEDDNEDYNKTKIKIPFCYIQSVLSDSPSEEAGFKEGDAIVKFGNVNYNVTNPLEKISAIVKNSINKEINVEVFRKGANESVKLVLIPKQWSGNGVLGCKLSLSQEH